MKKAIIKKVLKGLIFILIALLLEFFILGYIFFRPFIGNSGYHIFGDNGIFIIKQPRMEEILDENYSDLLYAAEYIMAIDFDGFISIEDSDEGYIITKMPNDPAKDRIVEEIEKIENSELFISTLDKLKANGFHTFICRYDNKYINFCRWSDMGKSSGLLYCVDGEPEIDWHGDTTVEKTEKENWYYYLNNGYW